MSPTFEPPRPAPLTERLFFRVTEGEAESIRAKSKSLGFTSVSDYLRTGARSLDGFLDEIERRIRARALERVQADRRETQTDIARLRGELAEVEHRLERVRRGNDRLHWERHRRDLLEDLSDKTKEEAELAREEAEIERRIYELRNLFSENEQAEA